MKYPKDRFDDLPNTLKRRGAHRAPRTRMSKLFSWIVALVAFALLVGLGVGVMWMIDKQVQFLGDDKPAATGSAAPSESTEPTPTPTPTGPAATVDPNISVTVLNGTGTNGLATAGNERLLQAGFAVNSILDADSFDNPTTTVVVASEDEMGAALGAVEALGFGEAKVDPSVASPGQMVVTLGADAEAALLG